ncbi:RNA polymerase sigma factor [Flectobacillus roseus]
MIYSIINRNRSQKDLYEGVKDGDSWAFSFIYQKTYASHVNKMNQEKDVAYDIFQEVIIDLFEKVKLGTLEKREENTSKMILKWVNQHLEWKRLDYWKSKQSSRFQENIDNHSDSQTTYVSDTFFYKEIIREIQALGESCIEILMLKLIDELDWDEIYVQYPTVAQATLRMRFSNCLKLLRQRINL